MKHTFPILTCCVLSMLAGSCGKHSDPITGGGKGGSAVLCVTPEHHNSFVDTCTIYIKYGTNDAPANGIYDDSAVCIMKDTTPVATFRGLTRGQYYLYGQGTHFPYVPANVKGGIPCTIINNTDSNYIYLPTYTY